MIGLSDLEKQRKRALNILTVLVVAEIAFSFMLSLYSGMMLGSFGNLLYIISGKNGTSLLSSSLFYEIFNCFLKFLTVFVPFFVFANIKKVNFSFADGKTRIIKKFPAVYFSTVFISTAASVLSHRIFSGLGYTVPASVDLSGYSVPAAIVSFISVCILTPVFEEYAFRGVMLHFLLPYGGIFAVFGSGLLFGLMHKPDMMLSAFIIGSVMSYITVRTGNTKNSLFLHMIINTVSFSLSLVDEYGSLTLNMIAFFVYTVLLIVGGIFSVIYVVKHRREFIINELHDGVDVREKVSARTYVTVGTVLLLLHRITSFFIAAKFGY